MIGTNFFTKANATVDVALADENRNARLIKCTVANLPTGAGYAIGCIAMTEAGVTYLNKGTATTASFISSTLSSTPTGSGIGYTTGAGGAVTQLTNRVTGVTINKLAGKITTSNASLAAEASASFVVTNSTVAIGDVIVVSQQSGAVGVMTTVEVIAVAAGSFTLSVMNGNAAAGVAETGAIIINFAVIKSVAA